MDMWVHTERRTKIADLRELLALGTVNWMNKKGRLMWFGNVDCKDDTCWVKLCMIMATEGRR